MVFASTAEAVVLEKGKQEPGNPTTDLVNSVTDNQLKTMVLSGTIETAITDSGATSSCGKKVTSKCRNYMLDTSALVATGLPSNKVFRYAEGNLGVADEIKHLPFDVRGKAKKYT